ncbi:hypothetical protein V5O48_012077, partial [Marasmius crinis-equi]
MYVEGRKSYAFQQVSIQEGLVAKFKQLWALPDKPRKGLPKRSSSASREEEEEEDEEEQ